AIASGSVTARTMRMGPPHREQTETSIWNTRASNFIQDSRAGGRSRSCSSRSGVVIAASSGGGRRAGPVAARDRGVCATRSRAAELIPPSIPSTAPRGALRDRRRAPVRERAGGTRASPRSRAPRSPTGRAEPLALTGGRRACFDVAMRAPSLEEAEIFLFVVPGEHTAADVCAALRIEPTRIGRQYRDAAVSPWLQRRDNCRTFCVFAERGHTLIGAPGRTLRLGDATWGELLSS